MLKTALNNRGIAVIWVAISLSLIVAAAIMALDLSAIQTTRTQLQNAADAAALAAATELVPDGRTVEERKDDATDGAIAIAAENRALVGRTIDAVNINAGDVIFPIDTRVTVTTHRTEATGDPLHTYFIKLLPPYDDDGLADIWADATAEVISASGTAGLFPWVLPDRYEDKDGDGKWDFREDLDDTNSNGLWDPGEDFDDVDKDGVWDEGDFYDSILTGYGTAPPSPFNDAGIELVLKQGNPAGTLTSGFFYPTRMPPTDHDSGEDPYGGASIYEDWIINKSPYVVRIGDVLRLEYGNMVGPTKKGVNTILDNCPTSYFDMPSGPVLGHNHPTTVPCPRIGAIAFFDPSNVQGSSDKLVTVVKLSYWFVNRMAGKQNTIYGRLIEIADPDAVGGGGFSGGFIYSIKLVE